MRIKIHLFQTKKKNKIARASIEFADDSILSGLQLTGFTICEDLNHRLYVQFPATAIKLNENAVQDNTQVTKPFFFFLRGPVNLISRLESLILDEYEKVSNELVKVS